ncbi:MAG: hypothetical protein A2029_03405 [Chloroflexi bacterium RBG_19FT_COMBO_47_9]|nr:MAG: hypothetical protein A2Y53_07550 [Chloroflexi bacterium RBG_16_47_49]OGO63245.1 MAG: hypothetical protein A2029_03405 [Chloroflexi bacterium RBG_19FT_COMBO_47_9]
MKDREELVKEVFAWFGAAYYHSEVLRRDLCNYYAMATFENVEDITRPRIEEKLAFASSLTLGQIFGVMKQHLPINLQQQVEVALDQRNYIAHHFWYERCHLMFSEHGLLELQQELRTLSGLFSLVDEKLWEYFKPKIQVIGITDSQIQDAFNSLISGDSDEPLQSQRLPQKQERLVRVWDIKNNDTQVFQIFETEDGCLWQLCDVGLGWTKYKSPSVDWMINERVQDYLPANINPRPFIKEAWNYQFNLAKGAILMVKRGKRGKSYKLGIKVVGKS